MQWTSISASTSNNNKTCYAHISTLTSVQGALKPKTKQKSTDTTKLFLESQWHKITFEYNFIFVVQRQDICTYSLLFSITTNNIWLKLNRLLPIQVLSFELQFTFVFSELIRKTKSTMYLWQIVIALKAWFILPTNMKRILTSLGCFRSECFAGVEHSSTVANYSLQVVYRAFISKQAYMYTEC